MRSIIDRELSQPIPLEPAMEECLLMVADEYLKSVERLFDEDPDLVIDR